MMGSLLGALNSLNDADGPGIQLSGIRSRGFRSLGDITEHKSGSIHAP